MKLNFDEFVDSLAAKAEKVQNVVGPITIATVDLPKLKNTKELATVLTAAIGITLGITEKLPEQLQEQAVEGIVETTASHIDKFIRDHFDVSGVNRTNNGNV